MILRSDQFCKDFKLEFSVKSMNNILHMQTENGWKREFHILKTEYDEMRQPINISVFQWIQSFQRQKNHLENIFHNRTKWFSLQKDHLKKWGDYLCFKTAIWSKSFFVFVFVFFNTGAKTHNADTSNTLFVVHLHWCIYDLEKHPWGIVFGENSLRFLAIEYFHRKAPS